MTSSVSLEVGVTVLVVNAVVCVRTNCCTGVSVIASSHPNVVCRSSINFSSASLVIGVFLRNGRVCRVEVEAWACDCACCEHDGRPHVADTLDHLTKALIALENLSVSGIEPPWTGVATVASKAQ
jgi:hypothetical protein